MLAAERISF